MYKSVITVALLFIGVSSILAQSQKEADSLRKALSKSSPDTTRISLLLKLAEFEIFKPGELKTDLDSAAAYINQARLLNDKIKSAEALGHITLISSNLARERGQREQGKALAEKAIQIFSNSTDKYQLGQAYFALSDYYNYDDPAESLKKIQLISQAAKSFNQAGNIEREAYCYKVLGDIESDDTKALQYLTRSLQLYQSINYKALQGVYDAIGSVYLYRTDFKEALNYQLKALKAAETLRDTTMQLCEINNHIGITHYKLMENKLAIKYFKDALVTAQAYNDVQTIYTLTLNICSSYRKLNQATEILNILKQILSKYPLPKNNAEVNYRFPSSYLQAYTMLKQFELAKPCSEQLLGMINNHWVNKGSVSDIYVDLINYFLASKQYSLALTYLNKNGALTDELKISTNISVNNLLWFKLDTIQHNYKAAVSHLLKYNRIRDSTYTAAKNREIQKLQLQFETKKKEDQIKYLNVKGALTENNLQKAKLVRNLTIGGIVLVLIIAALLYRQNRLKQKNNQVITQKNEEITHKNELLQNLVTEKEWLLKEVHHRVKNNLHSVICLLESQAAYLESDALKAIEESQHRIYTMSLIHQKLYQSDDIKTIDMMVYIPELVQYLSDSFDASTQIFFNMMIGPIQLNASQAIPLALIINEALTNSIKYAFPDKKRGEITISMMDLGDQYKLELNDNGIGLHQKEEKHATASLGLELMKGLVKEIGGEIFIESNKGVKITIIFDHDTLNDVDAFQTDTLASLQNQDIYL